MSLKTATLIALIGMVVQFCLRIPFYLNISWYRYSSLLGRTISVLNFIILNASIVLFLAVFYARHEE